MIISPSGQVGAKHKLLKAALSRTASASSPRTARDMLSHAGKHIPLGGLMNLSGIAYNVIHNRYLAR